MTTIPYSSAVAVPTEIGICSYCGASLTFQVTGGREKDDGSNWMPDEIEVECTAEPDFDSPAWHKWLNEHSVMPYVYMLPVEVKVLEWVQENFECED